MLTSVVSTASCASWKRGKPSATISRRRLSALGPRKRSESWTRKLTETLQIRRSPTALLFYFASDAVPANARFQVGEARACGSSCFCRVADEQPMPPNGGPSHLAAPSPNNLHPLPTENTPLSHAMGTMASPPNTKLNMRLKRIVEKRITTQKCCGRTTSRKVKSDGCAQCVQLTYHHPPPPPLSHSPQAKTNHLRFGVVGPQMSRPRTS